MPTVQSCSYDRSTADAKVDEVNMGTYTIGYIVITDGLMGPQSVANGALAVGPNPLPSLWSTYSYQTDSDSASWAREYDVRRDPNSVKLYYIAVTYRPVAPGDGSATSGGAPVRSESNPMAREPVVWLDREVYTAPELVDKDGKTILNKCFDYYPEDIEHEHTRGVLVVEVNVESIAQVAYYSRMYDSAVNASTWQTLGTSFPARTVLCREVSAGPPITEQGVSYFKLVFRFALKHTGSTWDERKTEIGQFHWTKTGAGTDYDRIIIGGTSYRKLTDAMTYVALNDDGTRREYDQPLVNTLWRVRREVDFNQLPF